MNEVIDAFAVLELNPVGPAVVEELTVQLGINELMPEVALAMLERDAVGPNVVALALRLDTDQLMLEDGKAVGPAVLLKFMELEGPIDGVAVGDELVVELVALSGRVVFIKTALMAVGSGWGKLVSLAVLR